MRLSLVSAPLVAALVGFGSTIALVLAAAVAVGATPGQTASWVCAICLVKGLASSWLSLRARVPVIIAWSTPGAALIAATQGVTMAEAAGAFLLAAGLIVATGLVRPLGRLVGSIPDSIAAAMLAGVLLPFCLQLPGAAATLPMLVLPMVAMFLGVRLVNPSAAVLAALATGLVLTFASGAAGLPDLSNPWPHLEPVTPSFRVAVLFGLGVPLYLVTMASQNLPGFATMRAHGYEPPVGPALVATGAASGLGALFGAHTISMAAITAALCMGPDVHPDPGQRWKAGVIYGAIWIGLALIGPTVVAVLTALPPGLIGALVGLALLGPFTGAAGTAFAAADTRFAAAVTLVVTASGVAVAGVGAAFWGLVAGLAVWGTERLRT